MSGMQKEAPMKPFLVGKTRPIAPITTQTTALANDQLLPPPLPPLPPLPPSPRLGISARRGRFIHWDHGAPIDNAVAAEHESCPATTTAAAAAAVIAALASECCMQLSRDGSGYGGRSGHHVPYTVSTPGYYSTITSTTTTITAAPTVVAATVTHEGDPADAGRRNQDTFQRYQALRVRQLGDGRGHCRRRREMIGGVKRATVSAARCGRESELPCQCTVLCARRSQR